MPAKHFVSAVALVSMLMFHTVSAVSLSQRGIGQALVFPYYTVNKNQDTLISVTNASAVSKAVQVRFREGYDGREVLGFVLFLSPHDVWTASVSQLADDGGAAIRTGDASCTLPRFPGVPVAFSPVNYDGTGLIPGDGGPTGITRTREGMIEIIAGADITPGSPTDVAITHVLTGNPGEGEPANCTIVTAASAVADEVAPTEGLFGSASIVNVGEGTFFAYNADAIAGFTATPLFSAALGLGISLADANSSETVGGAVTAYLLGANDLPLALDYEFGIDAVSAVFMADTLYNDYIVAASLGANTDWVVTFPTKGFYVDPQYSGVPIAPFTDAFAEGVSNVDVSGNIFDREEGSTSFEATCSLCPPHVPPPVLAYQVNVLPFRNEVAPTAPSGVFGSNLSSLSIPPYGDAGHFVLNFAVPDAVTYTLPGGIDTDGVAVTLVGLPAAGFMAYNVINANAQPGMLANYSGAFPHRATTACQGNADGCAPVITGDGAAP